MIVHFPILNALASNFNVSHAIVNLTLTSYMICQGLAPPFFGDLADAMGRRPAYILGFLIYIGANIGLSLSQNFASLLVFRCIQSTGSSSAIALGSGVVADIATSSERGSWMGWATTGPMIASSVGPVVGGLLSQYLGWRSVFWFLVIIAATFLVAFSFCFPETGRNVVGDGSIPPPIYSRSLLQSLTRRPASEPEEARQANSIPQRQLRWPNPLHAMALLKEKDIGLLLCYNAVVFSAFYDVTAAAPSLFAEIYGLNDLQIGLAFIPFGVGCFLAPISSGWLLDRNFKRVGKQAGVNVGDSQCEIDLTNFPLEKSRIQVTWPLVAIGTAGVLGFGWTLEAGSGVSIAAPLVMMFIVGWAYSAAFNCTSTMMVDFYPTAPATVIAANNLVRCELGAGTTAAVVYGVNAMGRGWFFTLIAGIVAILSPVLWILQRWGPQWREERRQLAKLGSSPSVTTTTLAEERKGS
jgi:multidrug resistance protein